MKNRKKVFWALFGFYSLGLLVWPFTSFGAIFAFDDPNANLPFVYYLAFSIWLYPLYLFAGYRLGHFRRNPSILAIIFKTSIPLLSANLYLGIPVGGSLAWSFLTDESLAETERKREHRRAELDPIYEQRIEKIKARDPISDAREAVERGDLALLPTSPNGNYYHAYGTEPNRFINKDKNYEIIVNSVFLSKIFDAIDIDPAHDFPDSYYISDVFREYQEITWEYADSFNQAIYPYLLEEEKEASNKSAHTTPAIAPR